MQQNSEMYRGTHERLTRRLHPPLLLILAIVASTRLTSAQTLPRMLLSGNYSSSVDIVGWRTGTAAEVAKKLAAKLVDTAKFVVKKASFDGDVNGAGFATFSDCGRWDPELGGAGKPPGHFLAPWFPKGAVVLSTAKIVGNNFGPQLVLTPERSSPLIPGSIRAVTLNLELRALSSGYLKLPWYWTDAAYTVLNMDEARPVYTESTFRILINGVDRALTADNRLVRLPSLYMPNPDMPDEVAWYVGGDVKRLHNRIDRQGNSDTIEPIEFGGLAYVYSTKRVPVKAGETVKISIVLGDVRYEELGAPSVLYLQPKSITTTPVSKCAKDAQCGANKICCAGFCCSKEVQCCSGNECCANRNAKCLPASPLAVPACCPQAAACNIDGNKLCCAPGSRCVDGSRCEA